MMAVGIRTSLMRLRKLLLAHSLMWLAGSLLSPSAWAVVDIDFELSPLAGENLSAVDTWELCFEASDLVHRIAVGVQPPTNYSGTMSWVACDGPGPGTSWDCAGTSAGMPPYMSVDADNSFSEALNGNIYLVLSGNLGVLDGALNLVANSPVCVARLSMSDPIDVLSTSDRPSLLPPTYPDIQNLYFPYPSPGFCIEPVILDGDGCSPPGGANYATQVTSTQPDDSDGDLRRDEEDNCLYTANANQEDDGGLEISAPDGTGNACQCGEGDGNGEIQLPGSGDADLSNMLSYLREGVAPDFDPLRCTVASASSLLGCSIHDAVVLDRALQSTAVLESACSAYNP